MDYCAGRVEPPRRRYLRPRPLPLRVGLMTAALLYLVDPASAAPPIAPDGRPAAGQDGKQRQPVHAMRVKY